MGVPNGLDVELVKQAQIRLRGYLTKSPLIPFYHDVPGKKIFLKLENLHPVGSFKLRGACNTILSLSPEQLKDGVCTISTGNFGHALAWIAKQLGVPCHVVVPDHVPDAKMAGVLRHGGHLVRRPWDEWWGIVQNTVSPDMPGFFLHPEEHDEILAGNGTVALEILEDLPNVDTVIIPYGSGGLTAGMGTTLKALRPDVTVCACEVASGAPLTAARQAGKPTETQFSASFVDGISSPSVLPKMYDIVKSLVDQIFVADLDEVAVAMQRLAETNHVIAEGAGACSVAASMFRDVPGETIVCVVTGGNIDLGVFSSLVTQQKH